MDSNIQPSFLPKKQGTQTPGKSQPKNISLFTLIAGILFFLTLILSGVVFFYESHLNKELAQRHDDLQAQLDKFDPSLVAQLTSLDNRLITSSQVFNNHVAISRFFTALSDVTLTTVQFRNLNLSTQIGVGPTISMEGKASSFTTLALQRDEFSQGDNPKYFKNVKMSGNTLATDGTISFTLSADVDVQNLFYKPRTVGGTTPTATTTQP